jgi:ketopantoate reductase
VSYSPQTPVLSAVSLIGSEERSVGHIIHDEADRVFIGAFENANINAEIGVNKAREFVDIYSKGGKTDCIYSANVHHDRWKKLVYNACLNPICAITGLDTGKIRLADGGLDGLVKPAMREIVQAAKAVGVDLPENVVDFTINVDPLESYLKPSMQQDLGKVFLILFYCSLFVLAL